jgi:tetratricopeptide (TPR) repeat protein
MMNGEPQVLGTLTVTQDGAIIQRLDIRVSDVTIGRAPDNTIVLADPRVSRYHASLHLEPGRATLTDLRSRSGTRVDDVTAPPEQPITLASESRITIEPFVLRYAAASVAAVSALSQEITSVTDPLLKMGLVTTIDDMIGASIRHVLAEAGPRQAEVLRRCAIPRWFDVDVLAVLREREGGAERTLELLRGYSFVRQLDATRFAYHEEVRQALLNEWREQRPDDLRAISARLAEYFSRRKDGISSNRIPPPAPLSSLAPLSTPPGFAPSPRMRAVDPVHTTISIAPTGAYDLWARESLYHTLQSDPQAGMEALRAAFTQAEASHRLADAEALIQITRDVPLDPAALRWVRYMRARIERAALRLDNAARQFRAILDEPALDPLLEAKARQSLGEVYAETGQWAQATELYLRSRDYFRSTGQRQDEAHVMLRLGEAYQELGDNTGGWHVPAYPQNPVFRSLGRLWNWALSLPFFIVAFFLRRTPWTLPRPRYLASYHNWLLVWIYRNAQNWYERARVAFAEQGDDAGVLIAEQRLADILMLFGYTDDALAKLDELRTRPAAQDVYRRAWIDCGRAAALLLNEDTTAAKPLLAAALERFREVGDLRREATVRALQSYAATIDGEVDTALAGYRSSLEQFRALRFTAAREQVLYALRAWQRRIGPGEVARRIDSLLAAEPEKRYVARFPRSRLPLLQALSLAALPLVLLAVFSPTFNSVIRAIPGSQLLPLVLPTVYDPWQVLRFLLAILILYSIAYTLVALAVIFFIPMDSLDREQPDYIVTDDTEIARYDYRGVVKERIRWDEVSRWVRVDRKLWQLPMSLFSVMFLEARDGRDVQIDGIISWYTHLQDDIRAHMQRADRHVEIENFDLHIFKSFSGATLALGLLLLLFFVRVENGAANWFIQLLPPPLYAGLAFFVLSGALALIPLAHWFATRPLEVIRELRLHDSWAYIIGAIGLAMVLMYVISGGRALPLDALNIGTFLWGAYVVADVVGSLVRLRWRLARPFIIALALGLATVVAIPQIARAYASITVQAQARQTVLIAGASVVAPVDVGDAPGQLAAAESVLRDESIRPEDDARAYTDGGDVYRTVGEYEKALWSYNRALESFAQSLDPDWEAQARAYLGRALTLRALDEDSEWLADLRQACRINPQIAPECATLP